MRSFYVVFAAMYIFILSSAGLSQCEQKEVPFDVQMELVTREVMGSYTEFKETFGDSWVEDCQYTDEELMYWALLPNLSKREAKEVARLFVSGHDLKELLTLVFMGGVNSLKIMEDSLE